MKNRAIKGFMLVVSTFIFILTISCEEDNIQFISEANDSDGDGVENSIDEAPENPCLPLQQMAYSGFNVFNTTWASADCDGDGVTNGDEFENKIRNPYLNENMVDTDGDGVADFEDAEPENPCIPEQEAGYIGFNSENDIWASADCDEDTILNIDEFINGTDPYLACNLNFDLRNFQRELRTVDSNNGEGITIGKIGANCGEFFFTGGGIFNQGCFNEDVAILFVLEPNGPDSSEGTISVPSTTYSCLSEDGNEIREFTVEGTGKYQGELSRIELNYTMLTSNGAETGTLNIRGLNDPGENNNVEDDGDCDLISFEGAYNTIININGNESFGTAILNKQGDGCNDFTLSGDFLNLGCGNNFEIDVFFGAEDGGSEIIIQETVFMCETGNGDQLAYTLNGFGNYSLSEGFFQLTEFSLTGPDGNTSNGAIFFEKADQASGGDCELDSFAREYNTIINNNGAESFGIAIFTATEGCGNFTLSGDFLNLGCTNDFTIEAFFGAPEDGGEVIIEEVIFVCGSESGEQQYSFTAFGNYSPTEGFIEFSEFTLTDATGTLTMGSIFFEAL